MVRPTGNFSLLRTHSILQIWPWDLNWSDSGFSKFSLRFSGFSSLACPVWRMSVSQLCFVCALPFKSWRKERALYVDWMLHNSLWAEAHRRTLWTGNLGKPIKGIINNSSSSWLRKTEAFENWGLLVWDLACPWLQFHKSVSSRWL